MKNDTLDFTSEQFKELYNKLEGEPEFRIYFSNHSDEYMVIKYDAKVSFQRCGVSDGSGEIYFDSLDCLFIANTIDDICLERDWESVTDIILDDWYHLSDKNDIDKPYSEQKENGMISTFPFR